MDFTYTLKDSYLVDNTKNKEILTELSQTLSSNSNGSIEVIPTHEEDIIEIRPYEIYNGDTLVESGALPHSLSEDEIPTFMNNAIECIFERLQREKQEKIDEMERKKILFTKYEIDTDKDDLQRKEINLPNGYPVTFFVEKNTSLFELKHIEECEKYTLDEVIAMNTPQYINPESPLQPGQPAEPFAWMILQAEREASES